jgi:hypothetical protein
VTYAVYRQELHTVRDRTADQVVSIGGLKASQITEWLGDRQNDANLLRANEPIARLIGGWLARGSGPLPAAVRNYFTAIRDNFEYASIVVFDANARQRWPAAAAGDTDP